MTDVIYRVKKLKWNMAEYLARKNNAGPLKFYIRYQEIIKEKLRGYSVVGEMRVSSFRSRKEEELQEVGRNRNF